MQVAPDVNFFLNSRKQGLPCQQSLFLFFFFSPFPLLMQGASCCFVMPNYRHWLMVNYKRVTTLLKKVARKRPSVKKYCQPAHKTLSVHDFIEGRDKVIVFLAQKSRHFVEACGRK